MYDSQPYLLLIDDDSDDLEMLSSELILKGIKVKTFASSAKALSYLSFITTKAELPSLIILDYNMPQKSGYQVLLLLKENVYTKNIPVVIYSTSIPYFLRKQLLDAGALDCFIKVWSYLEFTMLVNTFEELAFSLVKQGGKKKACMVSNHAGFNVLVE